MQLHIQLFAGLAERLQTSRLTYETSTQDITVDQLKQQLAQQYSEAAELLQASFVAVNQEYAPGSYHLKHTDEIALIPPVSGGDGETITDPLTHQSADGRYVISAKPLSIDEVTSKVLHPDHGAVLTFTGTTREMTGQQRTVHLEYEAYIPMALSKLQAIGHELSERWPDTLCAISHRIGQVDIMEISVIIAVSTGHRESCYAASRYAIERLKQNVPIWKKEVWENGSTWKGHQLGPWNPTSGL